jgi:hypothetical protein
MALGKRNFKRQSPLDSRRGSAKPSTPFHPQIKDKKQAVATKETVLSRILQPVRLGVATCCLAVRRLAPGELCEGHDAEQVGAVNPD